MKMDVRFRHVFFAGSIGALAALIGVAFGIGHIASAAAAQAIIGGSATPPPDEKNFYPLGECPANITLMAREVRLMACTFVAPVNIGEADFVQASIQTGAFDRIRGWISYAGTDRKFPTREVLVYYFVENTADRPAIAVPTASAVLYHVPVRGALQMETPKAATLGVVDGQ